MPSPPHSSMHNIKALIQVASIVTVAGGIVFEILTGAPMGYVLITVGALVFAISTKLRRG